MPVYLIPKTKDIEFTAPSDQLHITCSSYNGEQNSSCKLYLYGAHITSWETNGKERLWMSSLSCLSGKAPIRGGIPIAFPQFADNGQLKLHGFVREKVWTICSRIDEIVHTTHTPRARTSPNSRYTNHLPSFSMKDPSTEEVVLELVNDKTNLEFPLLFRLVLTIKLTLTSLSMKLDVFNLQDDNILPFTGCFHPYFYIPNINDASISGLSGFRFIDKVDGFKENPPSLSAADLSISMESESRKPEEDDTSTNMYYIDRIYKDTAGSKPLVLKTNSLDEDSLIITKSDSWADWVIFNPWKEGKKGDKGPDFDDDGYKNMVCIEPAVALDKSILESNESWSGGFTVEIVNSTSFK